MDDGEVCGTLDGVHGFDSCAGLRLADYRRDTMQDAKELLEDVHGDRVFAVEDDVVWSAG